MATESFTKRFIVTELSDIERFTAEFTQKNNFFVKDKDIQAENKKGIQLLK